MVSFAVRLGIPSGLRTPLFFFRVWCFCGGGSVDFRKLAPNSKYLNCFGSVLWPVIFAPVSIRFSDRRGCVVERTKIQPGSPIVKYHWVTKRIRTALSVVFSESSRSVQRRRPTLGSGCAAMLQQLLEFALAAQTAGRVSELTGLILATCVFLLITGYPSEVQRLRSMRGVPPTFPKQCVPWIHVWRPPGGFPGPT